MAATLAGRAQRSSASPRPQHIVCAGQRRGVRHRRAGRDLSTGPPSGNASRKPTGGESPSTSRKESPGRAAIGMQDQRHPVDVPDARDGEAEAVERCTDVDGIGAGAAAAGARANDALPITGVSRWPVGASASSTGSNMNIATAGIAKASRQRVPLMALPAIARHLQPRTSSAGFRRKRPRLSQGLRPWTPKIRR